MNVSDENEIRSYSLLARLGALLLAAAFPVPSLLYRYFKQEELNNQMIRLKLPLKLGSSIGLFWLVLAGILKLLLQVTG